MGKNNFKVSNTVNSKIVNIVKDPNNFSLSLTIEISVPKESDIIFKDATSLLEGFKIDKYFVPFSEGNTSLVKAVSNKQFNLTRGVLYLKSIEIIDTDGVINESLFKDEIIITNTDFVKYQTEKIIILEVSVKCINQEKYNEIDLSNYDQNDLTRNDLLVFMKIGAKKFKNNSGSLGKSINKSIREESNQYGTLPSSRITTGKKLDSNLERPFSDLSTFNFEKYSDIVLPVGLPLIKDTSNFNKYLSYYINNNNLSEIDSFFNRDIYLDKFSLSNSKVLSLPHSLGEVDNLIKITRKLKNDDLDDVVKQERFSQDLKPFDDSLFDLENDSSSEFFNKTLEKSFKNYKLSDQKKIKIELDFKNKVDLHLLNTKLAFNKEDFSEDTNDFSSSVNNDIILNTEYLNFMNDSAYSISSHYMPTAYWDQKEGQWNYLEGIKPNENYESILGHKNEPFVLDGKEYTDILNDFVFDNDSELETDEIIFKHKNIYNARHFSKPILTTPGFRNDGSFNKNEISNGLNKSPISQITDTYGFPYKATWQAHDNHKIKMSDYIGKNFLLEKVIIKGKYSSKGEMPVKKGNFASGYKKRGSQIENLEDFNSQYEMKDDHMGYISNSLTFFILNERKGRINNITEFKNISPLQHYNFLHTDESQNQVDNRNTHDNNITKKLKDFEGSFSSYEIFNNVLKVSSYNIPDNFLYTIDEYNSIQNIRNINIKSSRSSNVNHNIGTFNSSSFFFLDDDVNKPLDDKKNEIFIKNNSQWNSTNFSEDIFDNSYKTYRIKDTEYSSDINNSNYRDLVTYSNLLISSSESDFEFDENILVNIDQHIDKKDTNLNLNIDEDQPKEFVIKSFCKNKINSFYTDESEYKLKSNFSKTSVKKEEGISSLDFLFNFPDVSSLDSMFNFENNGDNNDRIFSLLNKNLNTNTRIPYIEPNRFLYAYIYNNSSSIPTIYEVYFSYENPSSSINGKSFGNFQTGFDESTSILRFSDFISVENVQSGSSYINKITINARIFQVYYEYSIYENFISLFDINEGSISLNNLLFRKVSSASNIYLNLDLLPRKWSSLSTKQKILFIKIITIFSSFYIRYTGYKGNIVNRNGDVISEISHPELTFNVSPEEGSSGLFNYNSKATLYFKKSIWNPLKTNNNINIFIDDDYYDSGTVLNSIARNVIVGNDEIRDIENYYNVSYNLEGKYLGESNGLGIVSDRVIDKEVLNYTLNESKTKSGKLIQNSLDSKKSLIRSNYLLKPEDELVFGVTSNSNGQVMPTVFRLHDKLEITLIGRDFIDDIQYKNNESKSIRRTIIGDDFIDKIGSNVYQTEGAYYDRVWSNSESRQKTEIGKNSSRKFGTYSGIITLDNNFEEDNEVFIKDTVHLSIGDVYKKVMNKELLSLLDIHDLREVHEISKNYDQQFSLDIFTLGTSIIKESNKIILTENSSLNENLKFTDNLVKNWHNIFYLEQYKDYFENNTIEIYNNTLKIKNTDKSLFIYYDIQGYVSNFSEWEKFYLIRNNDHDKIESESLSAEMWQKYQSFKEFCLPNSSLKYYQNGLQIKNNNFTVIDDLGNKNDKSFVKSDVLIDKNLLSNNNKISINKASLQYYNSGMNMTEYSNDVNKKLSSLYISPQWHLVFDITESSFNNLINNLNNKSFNINDNISLFLFEDDTDSSECVHKIGKITNKYESGGINWYQISIPLYFWETNEINSSFITKDENILYGRYDEREYNWKYNDALWFAKLNDNSIISDNAENYFIFVDEIVWEDEYSGLNGQPYVNLASRDLILGNKPDTYKNLQVKISSLSNTSFSIVENLLLTNKNYHISLSNFLNKDTQLVSNRSYSNNISQLNNFYKLNDKPRVYSHIKYFENDIDEIEKRKTNIISKDLSDDFYLNEKIYRSSIYKKTNNGFVKTRQKLVYKIHKLNTSYNLFDISEIDNFIIEVITFEYSNPVLQKDFVSLDNPLLTISNQDILRVYEEDLKEFLFLNEEENNRIPYFEIDLSSKTSPVSGLLPGNSINQIPYHYLDIQGNIRYSTSLSDVFPLTEKTLSELYSDDYINQEKSFSNRDARRLGTPLFKIEKIPSNFTSVESQENKIKNFFYGFSKGKYRYPIENLDGFKYGVENGSKKSIRFHFNNRRFGHFSDKIQGSTSTAVTYNDTNSNKTIVDFPIEKIFVNEYFQIIDASGSEMTYNKDKRARSTYPYIEDATNPLSPFFEQG